MFKKLMTWLGRYRIINDRQTENLFRKILFVFKRQEQIS